MKPLDSRGSVPLELSSQPHTVVLCRQRRRPRPERRSGVGGLMFGIGLLPGRPTRQRLSTPHDVMAENEDLHCEGPRFLTRAVSSSSATRTF